MARHQFTGKAESGSQHVGVVEVCLAELINSSNVTANSREGELTGGATVGSVGASSRVAAAFEYTMDF